MSTLRYSFNIESIHTVGNLGFQITPTYARNSFDEHGSLVALQRLPEESNDSYRRRIQDTLINYANSSYRGLINGITRELGLEIKDGIQINPRRYSSGEFLAPDPYIKIEGAFLYLYSDYKNNVLDYKIDIYQSGGNYEHFVNLVSQINSSYYFECYLLADIPSFTRSATLLSQSNRFKIDREFIPQTTKFKLKHKHIVRGSLFFNDRRIFKNEVETEALVTSIGKYYVDYVNGYVTVYSAPKLLDFARYQYVKYPFNLKYSPIVLYDINNQNFRAKMFKQLLQDSGLYINGQPNQLGVDIINEILSVYPSYWGI